jgi:hypothetical protein
MKTPIPRQFWTKEEDAQLTAMFHARTKCRIAAQKLGRSLHAVEKRRSILGLHYARSRAWTEEDDKRLKELRSLGSPIKSIAAKLDRTPESVTKRASAQGFRSPKKALRFDWQPMWVPKEMLHLCRRYAHEEGLHQAEYVRRVLAKHLETL